LLAAIRHQALETLDAGNAQENASVVWIIFDDE
jgi:hypothetical protein